MSTSAITKFEDEYGTVCAFYTQADGYPSEHGKDLKAFLEGFTIVNGLSSNQPKQIANGLDCLAAQAIKHFKDGPGHTYMARVDSVEGDYSYAYIINAVEGEPIKLTVKSGKKTLYKGDIKAYKPKD